MYPFLYASRSAPQGIQSYAHLAQLIAGVIEHVDENARRTRWNNERVAAQFIARSAAQIKNDKETFYMHPCVDLTTLAGEALCEQGYSPIVVVEELCWVNSGVRSGHIALEVDDEVAGTFFLDFARLNTVRAGLGRYYSGRHDVEAYRISRVPWSSIDPQQPLIAQLLPAEQVDFFRTTAIAKLTAENTDETWAKYQRELGPNSKLTLCEEL